MRNAVIGLIIGIVAGIVLGTTVFAPQLARLGQNGIGIALQQPPAEKAPAVPDAGVQDDKKAKPEEEAKNPAPVRINMASAFPSTLAGHGTAAKRLERTVWRISDGTLDLRFHPPGALAKADEALDAVISGAIDAYYTDIATLEAREPAFQLFAGPPFGASVAAYLGWMEEGGGRALYEQLLAEMGLSGIVCGMVPKTGGAWFRKPPATPEAFAGMRLRAGGVEAQLYRRLGAATEALSFADTLTALEAGNLDGAQMSAPHVDAALGLARDGLTYVVPGWRTPGSVFTLLMPVAKWEALAPVAKTRLRVACSDTVRHAIAEAEALQYNALKKITAAGTDVRTWPVEIVDAVRAAWTAEAKERQKSSQAYSRVLKSYRNFVKGQSIWEELSRP